ncbi:unnamed protein product [Callosobruchus maculatus]|uniref:Lipid-binding serum glycoprotein N-terminal domain-containing protein n=1 Tax=Callosobruchus maculatus TaxID=64391 RepID=A0A653D1D2_CALMS|nr:unnamed protein product [Callosobruchus maculatus]
MKILNVLSLYTLVLAGTASANWAGEGAIEILINTTLSKIIETLPDPFPVPAINLSLPNQSLLSGYLKVSNFKLAGIHKIVASKIKTAVIGKTTANITIEASDIHLDFDYDTDITLLELLPLYGAGSNHILLQNLNLELFTSLQVFGGIKVKELNATMNMQALLFDLHGLIYNEDFSKLASTMLNGNVGLFLNQYAQLISGYISPVLKELLNAMFNPKKNSTLEGVGEYSIPEYDLDGKY